MKASCKGDKPTQKPLSLSVSAWSVSILTTLLASCGAQSPSFVERSSMRPSAISASNSADAKAEPGADDSHKGSIRSASYFDNSAANANSVNSAPAAGAAATGNNSTSPSNNENASGSPANGSNAATDNPTSNPGNQTPQTNEPTNPVDTTPTGSNNPSSPEENGNNGSNQPPETPVSEEPTTVVIPPNCDTNGATQANLLTTSMVNGGVGGYVEYQIFKTDCEGNLLTLTAEKIWFDIDATLSSFVSITYSLTAGATTQNGTMNEVLGADLFGNKGSNFGHWETQKSVAFSASTKYVILRINLPSNKFTPRVGPANALPSYLRFGNAAAVTKVIPLN